MLRWLWVTLRRVQQVTNLDKSRQRLFESLPFNKLERVMVTLSSNLPKVLEPRFSKCSLAGKLGFGRVIFFSKRIYPQNYPKLSINDFTRHPKAGMPETNKCVHFTRCCSMEPSAPPTSFPPTKPGLQAVHSSMLNLITSSHDDSIALHKEAFHGNFLETRASFNAFMTLEA